ncbi:MAG TPA: hypothetical protein GX507_03735 [Clostridia bacterium]|nr:hypothetical protein [Clostridia bacterium]
MQHTRSSLPALSLSRIARLFEEAVNEVLVDSLGLEVTLKEVLIDKTPAESLEVTVIIGLTGDIEGNVFYTFSSEAAAAISEHAGLEPPEGTKEDRVRVSLLCEVANMISGRATVGFERFNRECRLTPPAIIEGRAVRMSTLGQDKIVLPFGVDTHPFVIHVAIKS